MSKSEDESESERVSIEVHKVLRLPRNLPFEVHQVLCLPRTLHFEVRQVLCLPRNLRFEFTKCCACHEICTSRLPRNLHFEVHKVLRLPRNLHCKVHKVLHLPRNLHFEVHQECCACHKIICTLRFTTAIPVTKSAHRGSQSAAPATKSANEADVEKQCFTLYLSRNQSSSTIRKVDIEAPKHEVFLAPATKSDQCGKAHGSAQRRSR